MNLKQLLSELNFRTQAAFDAYAAKHKMRPTTSVNVAGKDTTAGEASKKSKKKKKPTATKPTATKPDSPKKDKDDAISNAERARRAVDAVGKFKNDKEADNKKEEPKSEPAKKRPGNPTVNKDAKKKAEEFGITPQKLGNEGYKKAMYQAAVEALTDANFHDEARELIASIEGKPEWAKRVEYPSPSDPKFKEKMADLRKNGVDSSEYWGGEDNTHEFARKVASSSGWDGVDAADGIAFTLRMNGFHKEADKIQSIFDNKPYMKKEELTLKNAMKEAKSDYPVYHKTYTSAINTAREYAEKKGYQIDDDDAFTQIGMGPKKPSDGKTNRFSIQLFKDGKPQKKHLHIQVYNMGTFKRNSDGSKTRSVWGGQNEYELNAYIN